MAAPDPLQDILSAEIDESAVNALVGSLESRLASPSHKDLSNSLADSSVNNNHITTASSHNSSIITQTTNVTHGLKGLSTPNAITLNNIDNLKLNHTDSQIIGINSIINSNAASHINDQNNRGSPVLNSNGAHGVRVMTPQGNMNPRSSPLPPNNINTTNIGFTNSIAGVGVHASHIDNNSIHNSNTSFVITKPTDGSNMVNSQCNLGTNVTQPFSSQTGQIIVKQENVSASQVNSQTQFVMNNNPRGSPISNMKQEPVSVQTMQKVSGHSNINQVHHTSNVQLLNMGHHKGQTVHSGNQSVITVRKPAGGQTMHGGPVVMRPQIITSQSTGAPMQVVNVSGANLGPRLAPGKGMQTRVQLAPRQQQIAPRPGAGGTITLPQGTMIPPGAMLMKNEQGQLMFVTANQPGQHPGAVGGTRIQYVRPPNSAQPQPRPGAPQIVTMQHGGQINQQTVLRQSGPTSSASPAPTQVAHTMVRSQTPQSVTVVQQQQQQPPQPQQSRSHGHGSGQQPLDNVKKCKNFLSTLLKLAASQPQETVKNVRELIQGLIDGIVEPEAFTERLQTELKSSPQPYLVPFLKKSLPSLREAITRQKMTIEGVRAPPASVLQQHQKHPENAATIQLPNRLPMQQVVRTKGQTQVQLQPRRPAAQGSQQPMASLPRSVVQIAGKGGHPSTMGRPQGGVASPHNSARKEKTKFESLKDDDDINDVATMGGVNLTEESKTLASNADYVGTQIRSCKDETFLFHNVLMSRINKAVKKHGLEDSSSDVANIVSHATQERLRDIMEKLATIAEHRMEIYKINDKFESASDVRSQLKFLEELDKLEKKRHEDQEWEKIMKAAKSRSKHEDPEQQKIKQKAKELQQAETERLRQEEANQTALAAIGPRKKRKTESAAAAAQGSSSNMDTSNGSGSSSSRSSLRPRIKRVTLRDALFLLEQEPSMTKSETMYRTYLK